MTNITGLSGGQIDWLLDHLIEKAIRPLAEASGFLRRLSAEILCQPFTDLRRKISAFSTTEANCKLFAAICSRSPERQIEHFMSAKIERNLTHAAVTAVTDKAVEYRHEVIMSSIRGENSPKVEAFNRIVGGIEEKLFTAVQRSEVWIRQYEKLRNQIVMQFEGIARATTDSIVRGTILAVDYDDMYKNMMLGVQRAIDKYSSHKGTLISYVKLWMRDAHTNPQFQHEYGNAFTVSAGERRRITTSINSGNYAFSNLSVDMDEASTISIDTPTPEKLLEDENTGIVISHILANIPNARYAFLTMEIPYYLNTAQRALLSATLKKRR
jgi:hypothetical protein